MSSLKEQIDLLEEDLTANPPRISVYHDLPFAILRYDPNEEWNLRKEVRLLATRLEDAGKVVHIIFMSQLLWKVVQESEGIEEIVNLEKKHGYIAAQEQITTYLSDRIWRPLADQLAEKLQALNQTNAIAFLVRTAAMSPGIYHMSKLLDEMHGRTTVTTILFYPGSIEGTTGLKFMAMKDYEALGNYRVKIYG